MNPDIFEVIMLVCFGAAWPFSIYKMLKSKNSAGKSVLFLFIIFTGYIAGTLFQYFGERNIVIFLYMLNACMVMTDIGLTMLYRKNN
ncbi:MAG: hypothetical protein P9M13_00355 [Candidatus Ancaeobacter aquaticus]|nr:hypothetical protein [Candidatus Ancaeobacter aquaticus]